MLYEFVHVPQRREDNNKGLHHLAGVEERNHLRAPLQHNKGGAVDLSNCLSRQRHHIGHVGRVESGEGVPQKRFNRHIDLQLDPPGSQAQSDCEGGR